MVNILRFNVYSFIFNPTMCLKWVKNSLEAFIYCNHKRQLNTIWYLISLLKMSGLVKFNSVSLLILNFQLAIIILTEYISHWKFWSYSGGDKNKSWITLSRAQMERPQRQVLKKREREVGEMETSVNYDGEAYHDRFLRCLLLSGYNKVATVPLSSVIIT